MKTAIRFMVILGVLCVAAGGGVALLYAVFQQPIADKKVQQYRATLQELFPEMDKAEVLAGRDTEDTSDDVTRILAADGQVLGYAAQGHKQGYSSDVKVLVGFAPDGKTILKVAILEQQETPGLGANAALTRSKWTLWQKIASLFGGSSQAEPMENAFLDQFVKRTPDDLKQIDAMTAATITSEAVKHGVRTAAEDVLQALKKKE